MNVLGTAIVATFCTIVLTAAHASVNLPSEEELKQWDQLFTPGLYAVEEYSVDDNLEPIKKTIKRKQYCFSKTELEQVSRLPFTTAALWQCDPTAVRFEPPNLAVTMRCAPTSRKGSPVAGMAVVGQTGDNAFVSRLIKAEQGAKPRTLYAVGSTMTRLSDCNK